VLSYNSIPFPTSQRSTPSLPSLRPRLSQLCSWLLSLPQDGGSSVLSIFHLSMPSLPCHSPQQGHAYTPHCTFGVSPEGWGSRALPLCTSGPDPGEHRPGCQLCFEGTLSQRRDGSPLGARAWNKDQVLSCHIFPLTSWNESSCGLLTVLKFELCLCKRPVGTNSNHSASSPESPGHNFWAKTGKGRGWRASGADCSPPDGSHTPNLPPKPSPLRRGLTVSFFALSCEEGPWWQAESRAEDKLGQSPRGPNTCTQDHSSRKTKSRCPARQGPLRGQDLEEDTKARAEFWSRGGAPKETMLEREPARGDQAMGAQVVNISNNFLSFLLGG
jgi:hypothetical protein